MPWVRQRAVAADLIGSHITTVPGEVSYPPYCTAPLYCRMISAVGSGFSTPCPTTGVAPCSLT
jgi:hypothetical protein